MPPSSVDPGLVLNADPQSDAGGTMPLGAPIAQLDVDCGGGELTAVLDDAKPAPAPGKPSDDPAVTRRMINWYINKINQEWNRRELNRCKYINGDQPLWAYMEVVDAQKKIKEYQGEIRMLDPSYAQDEGLRGPRYHGLPSSSDAVVVPPYSN